jgi:histidine triad (HIT) family protein
MTNSDCLFCKIIEKKIPAKIVYEDDRTIAFLDITPRTTGHTLVISKEHAPTIVALPEGEVGPLFLTVRKMSALLTKTLLCDGVTIGMNQGRASGQEVDHLHVHLLPRWHGDKGSAIQSVVQSEPKEDIATIQKKIMSGL